MLLDGGKELGMGSQKVTRFRSQLCEFGRDSYLL